MHGRRVRQAPINNRYLSGCRVAPPSGTGVLATFITIASKP
jgi:hypothetical protein